ncbi:MAG: DUF362 domain-containing protein [bacterium]|nr:DUF362 domain-containing protein [bacterium]
MRKPIPTAPAFALPRRRFLQTAASAAATAALPGWTAPASVPRTPTAIRICKRYDYALVRKTLGEMFDLIGGVRPLVKNKFVTVKVNLVNSPTQTWGGLPIWLTTVVHPVVAMAAGSLLAEYGAKQIVFCDQLPFNEPHEKTFARYNYILSDFNQAMDGKAVFENTRNKGRHGAYDLARVPYGGLLTTAWEVNQSYTKTDVLVSLGKMKNHISGGVTLSMKNLFGVPPSSLYGDDAVGEPNEEAIGYRGPTMHDCTRKPVTTVETFNGKTIEGEHGFNVPRFIVDLNAAMPVHLCVADAISTISTAEGAWMGAMVDLCRPNLLLAGLNPVCTDAVGAAVMGFDPATPDKTQPFINGTNYLNLSRELGLGENRLSMLDIVGETLETARFCYQPTYQR